MNHPLQPAFLATRYRICLDGAWTDTRIGERSVAMATWLAARGHAAASLVSARNPHGRALGEADNLARDARLREQLQGLGLSGLPAEGVADDARWREPSLWVPGLHGADCRALMRCFDQLAWVEYDADGVARLCWTADGPIEEGNPCR